MSKDKPYAVVWTQCKWTDHIIEHTCKNDADVCDAQSDHDMKVIKIEYTKSGEKNGLSKCVE
tara:strand:+ start:148 stop:333 length:186 start_codon:yes stop_codon:yes gene_type:complete